jgi:hypothetical protein
MTDEQLLQVTEMPLLSPIIDEAQAELASDDLQWNFLEKFYVSMNVSYAKNVGVVTGPQMEQHLNINTISLQKEYDDIARELRAFNFTRLVFDEGREFSLVSLLDLRGDGIKIKTALRIRIGKRIIFINDLNYFLSLLS